MTSVRFSVMTTFCKTIDSVPSRISTVIRSADVIEMSPVLLVLVCMYVCMCVF